MRLRQFVFARELPAVLGVQDDLRNLLKADLWVLCVARDEQVPLVQKNFLELQFEYFQDGFPVLVMLDDALLQAPCTEVCSPLLNIEHVRNVGASVFDPRVPDIG